MENKGYVYADETARTDVMVRLQVLGALVETLDSLDEDEDDDVVKSVSDCVRSLKEHHPDLF